MFPLLLFLLVSATVVTLDRINKRNRLQDYLIAVGRMTLTVIISILLIVGILCLLSSLPGLDEFADRWSSFDDAVYVLTYVFIVVLPPFVYLALKKMSRRHIS